MSQTEKIETKRIYEEPSDNDGVRVLIDRLWPRGVSKEDAELNEWMKDLAPSDELREWFSHEDKKWDEFKEKYFRELDKKEEQIDKLLNKGKKITLLYASKEEKHNNARALKQYIEENHLS